MAVLAPMPRASEAMATIESPGERTSLTQSIAYVMKDEVEPEGSAAFAAVFLDLVKAAELEAGAAASFGFRDAGADFVVDLGVEVEAELLVEIALQPAAR